jgi:hypothetical protein
MNFGKVMENVFTCLKNRWQILEIFNFRVNRALAITIACCVLCKYFEMWKIPKLCYLSDAINKDNFARFKVHRLPTLEDGE